jgi:hypothetical protein
VYGSWGVASGRCLYTQAWRGLMCVSRKCQVAYAPCCGKVEQVAACFLKALRGGQPTSASSFRRVLQVSLFAGRHRRVGGFEGVYPVE